MPEPQSFLSFYDPDFYDQEIGPGSRVPELYHSLASEIGGPILELGCGTGNILLPIACSGIEAWGVDASKAMLERAKRKAKEMNPAARLELALCNMEDFRLGARFRQIFLTNDVIAHVLDPDALLQTLSRCKEHLAAGGRVVLDIAPFDVVYLARYSDRDYSFFRHRGLFPLQSGELIQVWERTIYCPETGILTAHFRYEKQEPDGRLLQTQDRTLTLCPRSVEEVRFALLASGFEKVTTAAAGVHDGFLLTAR